jgi:hypothetical protein
VHDELRKLAAAGIRIQTPPGRPAGETGSRPRIAADERGGIWFSDLRSGSP